MSELYFAFGANTCLEVLSGRRGIDPIASEAAELRGHRLAFVQRGVPWIEPAFASVIAEPGASVHGVLHELRDGDLDRLDQLESSGYARVELRVIGRARGEVAASVYITRRPRFGLAPSRRYRDLLVRGAREHDLPDAWIAELEAIPCSYVPGVSEAMPWIVRVFERALRR